MFDFRNYVYDFENSRFVVGGESMIFHCHHYNTFLQRSIMDAEYVDSAPFLVGAAAESAFLQLSDLLSTVPGIEPRKRFVEELYRQSGFGTIDLSGVTENGGTVRTSSSHYSLGWKEKFGRSGGPVVFFSAGFLAGALAAVYGIPLSGVTSVQTACMSTGASEDVFVLGRGEANFSLFPPKPPVTLLPVEACREPDTPVDRKGIAKALAAMPILGNDRGIIPAFGVYLTRMYADYYNRISFEFEKSLRKTVGDEGLGISSRLFVEAGHVCGFSTFYGIMTSPEWDALIRPMLKSREDWVHGMVSAVNALGWGVWKVLELSPDRAVFRLANDYESLGYLRMYGPADHGISYLATGGAASIMNLVYVCDIESTPRLAADTYRDLFRDPSRTHPYQGRMTACQGQGDPHTEIAVERAP